MERRAGTAGGGMSLYHTTERPLHDAIVCADTADAPVTASSYQYALDLLIENARRVGGLLGAMTTIEILLSCGNLEGALAKVRASLAEYDTPAGGE